MKNKIIIDKQKLKEIMQFIIKTYTEGCASYNWKQNGYIDFIENKRDIEDYEIDNIIEESMNEFIYEDLGLCGCGLPESTYEVIRLILTAQSQKDWNNKKISFKKICDIDMDKNDNYYGLIQFVLYVLDDHEFLEHGSSIGGAWLTEKGKLFLELLNMWKEINKDKVE